MKLASKMQWRKHLLACVAAVAMALLVTIFVDGFSIVSHAESAAKVTASSAKIRKEPNASSEVIGSSEQNKEISIRSQVQGSDGYTWYEVYVNATTLGYIRSDLVEITDGTTPPAGTVSSVAPSQPSTPAEPSTPSEPNTIPDEPLVEVAAVEPASASVTGGESVRVRQNASTTSRIVTTVKNGMALTIVGTATGTDGKDWYQVTFIANGAETTGFIRSDYTTVSPEELSPGTAQPPEGGEPVTGEPPVEDPSAALPEEPSVEEKQYETVLEDGEWRLIDRAINKSYGVQELFDVGKENAKLYEDSLKTVKTQKIIIIVLVFLLISIAAVVTLLIFKIKDLEDAQYFNEVENETIRRRNARAQGGGQRVMPTVGGERPGSRQSGAKASGAPQGQRPQGGRAGTLAQGQRPAQGQQRQVMQGQKPIGGTQGQQRPAPQGQRPAGRVQGQQRPVSQNQRPAGGAQGQQRPAPQGQRPVGGAQSQQRQAVQNMGAQGRQNAGWQSKNFMADDDEFEFEFLNYEGDDEQ